MESKVLDIINVGLFCGIVAGFLFNDTPFLAFIVGSLVATLIFSCIAARRR